MRGAELCVGGVARQVAHLCVLYDRRMHSQRYYRGHDRQINAIAIAPNQRYHRIDTTLYTYQREGGGPRRVGHSTALLAWVLES